MHRKFIATIVAAALAVTVIGNAPARANDNVLGALAAIAGIAIVGKVIHDHNKRKDHHTPVTRQTYKTPVQSHKNRVYDIKPRPLPKRANRKLLPGNCLRSADTRQGRVRYFGQRCLQHSNHSVSRLPHNCKVRVRGQGHGYEARCLRRNGYELARR